MDKYQITFLKKVIVSVDNDAGAGSYDFDNNGNLVIIQNENYNITNYVLKIKNKNISSISYYVNAWKKINSENEEISIPIDFNHPVSIIKIALRNGVVDDFEVKVILKAADKEAWDEKHAKEVREARLNNIALVLNSEGAMHTVVFKPCCDEYAYTIVKWYAVSRIVARGQGGNVVIIGGGYRNSDSPKPMSPTFIEECKISDKFYCNNECAFNVAVEVIQYDKDGKELVSLTMGFKD